MQRAVIVAFFTGVDERFLSIGLSKTTQPRRVGGDRPIPDDTQWIDFLHDRSYIFNPGDLIENQISQHRLAGFHLTRQSTPMTFKHALLAFFR